MHEQNELNAVLEAEVQEEAVQDMSEETFAEQEVIADDAGESPTPAQDNFELTGNRMHELLAALESVTVEYEWGTMPRYCYADSDLETCMIYAWDCTDWLLYGFSYEMDGDNVVIDFESRKRMKYTIVEFDEGEQESPFMTV